jgi:hypothetical protein
MYTVDKAMERTKKRQNEITELQKLLKKEKLKLKEMEEPNDQLTLNNIELIINKIKHEKDEKNLKQVYEQFFKSIIWERNKWNEIKIKLKFK